MGRCTLESVLVCSCIEVLPVSESVCAMLGLVVEVGVLQCTVCGIGIFELSLLSSVPFTYYVHTALLAVHEWNG